MGDALQQLIASFTPEQMELWRAAQPQVQADPVNIQQLDGIFYRSKVKTCLTKLFLKKFSIKLLKFNFINEYLDFSVLL